MKVVAAFGKKHYNRASDFYEKMKSRRNL